MWHICALFHSDHVLRHFSVVCLSMTHPRLVFSLSSMEWGSYHQLCFHQVRIKPGDIKTDDSAYLITWFNSVNECLDHRPALFRLYRPCLLFLSTRAPQFTASMWFTNARSQSQSDSYSKNFFETISSFLCSFHSLCWYFIERVAREKKSGETVAHTKRREFEKSSTRSKKVAILVRSTRKIVTSFHFILVVRRMVNVKRIDFRIELDEMSV